MLYFRPSSEVERVSPVTACLVAVYGAELGRGHVGGDRTVVDDPAALRVLVLHDLERLRVQRKDPVRLTSTTVCHCSAVIPPGAPPALRYPHC